jgi:AcrR family transcriptional regulator
VPIPIDRAQRSAEVAQVAAQLIAQGGLEAVTFRNLAAVIGCSTTAISHYFPDAQRCAAGHLHLHRGPCAGGRARHVQADTGIGVAEVLQQILPIGEDQSDDWKVWLCFWTSALFDPRAGADPAGPQRSHARRDHGSCWWRRAGQPPRRGAVAAA